MSNKLLITIFFSNVDICMGPPDEPALTAIRIRYPKLTLILKEINIYFVHRVVSMANPFAKRSADEKKYAVVFVAKAGGCQKATICVKIEYHLPYNRSAWRSLLGGEETQLK